MNIRIKKLKYSIYQKTVDKNNLIPATSFHGSAMKKGLPFIQVLRIKIICSKHNENKEDKWSSSDIFQKWSFGERWDTITLAKEIMEITDVSAWWMRKKKKKHIHSTVT